MIITDGTGYFYTKIHNYWPFMTPGSVDSRHLFLAIRSWSNFLFLPELEISGLWLADKMLRCAAPPSLVNPPPIVTAPLGCRFGNILIKLDNLIWTSPSGTIPRFRLKNIGFGRVCKSPLSVQLNYSKYLMWWPIYKTTSGKHFFRQKIFFGVSQRGSTYKKVEFQSSRKYMLWVV